MKTSLKFALFALLTLSSFTLTAQSDSTILQPGDDYELLWEIKGPDGEQGYLFGTMHLRDERVFNLPDTLIPLIKLSEGFSLEVNMDTGIKRLMNIIYNSDTLYLDESEETTEGSTYKDFMRGFMKGMKNKDNGKIFDLPKPDRPFILDAFLLDIATRLDKPIYAVEDITDQMSLLDEDLPISPYQKDKEESNSQKEPNTGAISDFIHLYQTGNADSLYAAIDENQSREYVEELLDNRNVVMVQNMDSLLQLGTQFFAIGSGHLKGPKGVVPLLEEKGYELNPIESEFTKRFDADLESIPALEYDIFKVPGHPYSVEFPGEPVHIIQQLEGVEMYVKPNPGMDIIFGTYAFKIPKSAEQTDREMLESFVQMLKNDGASVYMKKEIEEKGIPGMSMSVNIDGQSSKITAFYYANRVIILEQNRMRLGAADYMDDFISSIEFLQPDDPVVEESDWIVVAPEHAAVQVDFPGEPEHQVMNSENPGGSDMGDLYLHLYSYTDALNSPYMFRWYDNGAGTIIDDDSLTLYSSMESYDESFGIPTAYSELTVDSLPCIDIEYNLENLYGLKVRECVRGNRVYTAFVQHPLDDISKANAQRFTESLKPLAYQETMPDTYQSELLPLSFITPGKAVRYEDNDTWYYQMDTSYNVYAVDPESGTPYMAYVYDYSEYFSYDQVDSFFYRDFEDYVTVDDSLGAFETFEYKGFPAAKATLFKKKSNTVYRLQSVFAGEYLITLGSFYHLGESDRFEPATEAFFNSLDYSGPTSFDPSESKLDMILEGLISNDSLIRDKAIDALPLVSIDSSYIERIFEILDSDLPDNSYSWGSPKYALFQKLGDLDSPELIPRLHKYYFEADSNELKIDILSQFVAIDAKEGVSFLNELHEINELPVYNDNFWSLNYILDPVNDSLLFLMEHGSTLQWMWTMPGYSEIMLNWVVDACQDSLNPELAKDAFTLYEKQVNTLADSLLTVHELMPDTAYDYGVSQSIYNIYEFRLLSKTPNARGLIERIANAGDTWVRVESMMWCLENDIDLSDETLLSVLDNPFDHILFLRTIQESEDELDIDLPEDLTNQSRVALSMFYESVDWEGWHEQADLLETTMVDFNGTGVRVYVYRYRWEEGGDWYLGISGPQPKSKKKYSLSGELTGTAWDEYDPGDYRKDVERLIQQGMDGELYYGW